MLGWEVALDSFILSFIGVFIGMSMPALCWDRGVLAKPPTSKHHDNITVLDRSMSPKKVC